MITHKVFRLICDKHFKFWLQCLLIIPCSQVMYFLLHMEKGTPFETADQGKFRYSTVWEQIDYGVQYSASRKFLIIVPVVL